ncbi:MAG: VOC family protein [Woeseiaceae bacterium]|jgi:predicted enzyme related to lactoylglutathione lyase
MHRSRLAGYIIDCQTDDLEGAADFWSAALGYKREAPLLDQYATLETPDVEPYLEVQAVKHASRVHLDIETDDIEAEVKRLEQLGAKRIETVKTWVVMEAPTGQRFCVIRRQHKYFDETANSWD